MDADTFSNALKCLIDDARGVMDREAMINVLEGRIGLLRACGGRIRGNAGDTAAGHTLQPDPLPSLIENLDVLFLRALDCGTGDQDWLAFNLRSFVRRGIDREMARRWLRFMRNRGLVLYEKGLWSEDGYPAGAGYRISQSGRDRLAALSMSAVSPEDPEAPYCEHGCGDRASVRLAEVGLCDDCAADAFRLALQPLAGPCCCTVGRDKEGNLRLCLTPAGVEHIHG